MKKTIILLLFFTTIFAQNNVALLIGVNYYETGNNLNFCENDIQKINIVLKSDAKNWDINTLLSKNATRKNILDKFEEIKLILRAGDSFFLYFSGHGTKYKDANSLIKDEPNGIDVAICPTDVFGNNASLANYHNTILDDELGLYFTELKKNGVNVYAFFDCCHSGTMSRNLSNNANVKFINNPFFNINEINTRSINLNELKPKKNTFDYGFDEANELSRSLTDNGTITAIGAAQDAEAALELPELEHGILTYVVSKELAKKGFLDEMFSILYSEIRSLSANEGAIHTPTLYTSDDFIKDFSVLPQEVKLIGIVKNSYGSAIPEANVGIIKPGRKITNQLNQNDFIVLAKTNSNGAFELKGKINEGRYFIKVIADGYDKSEIKISVKKTDSEYAPINIILTK